MSATAPRKLRSDGERSRQTILRAAASLATVDGLEGISIGNLAAHIGMSKSGLYAHFGSKEELQLATVETAKEIFDAEVVAGASAAADPFEQVRALYDAFLAHIERRSFPGGCFFASVTAEFDTRQGAVHDRIAEIQDGWTELVRSLLTQAQEQGEIRADEDPDQLAFELDAYVLKGNTFFLLHDDAAYLRRGRTAIARRLDLARPT
jgi:AcrR family transcriptional regulator